MIKNIFAYIREHGGPPWLALSLFTKRAMASDFLSKVAEAFATRILLVGMGLITSVLVARVLGPEGRGLYAVAAMFAAMGVQFGNLGLHASNTYHVSRNKALLPALVGNTLVASFVLGGSGSVLAWTIFSLRSEFAPVSGMLLVLSLLWIPFGLTYLLLQNLLLGVHEVRAYNKIELINQIVVLVFLSLLILGDVVSVEAFFVSGLIALVTSFGLALWALKKHMREFPRPSMPLFRENIGYGLKAYLAALFAFMVMRIDLLMVKYMLGAEQAGYYSIAVTMTDIVFMLPSVIGMILFPQLAVMSDDRRKWRFTKLVVLWVMLVMLLLTIIASLLATPVVRLLFGEVFLPAVPAFVWLMPGIFILSINVIYMNYFASIGMPIITVYSPGIAAIINILLNMKLIPMAGIVGASISSTLAYGSMLIASALYIRHLRGTTQT